MVNTVLRTTEAEPTRVPELRTVLPAGTPSAAEDDAAAGVRVRVD